MTKQPRKWISRARKKISHVLHIPVRMYYKSTNREYTAIQQSRVFMKRDTSKVREARQEIRDAIEIGLIETPSIRDLERQLEEIERRIAADAAKQKIFKDYRADVFEEKLRKLYQRKNELEMDLNLERRNAFTERWRVEARKKALDLALRFAGIPVPLVVQLDKRRLQRLLVDIPPKGWEQTNASRIAQKWIRIQLGRLYAPRFLRAYSIMYRNLLPEDLFPRKRIQRHARGVL